MSQSESSPKSKYPKITIRNREGAEGKLSVGANMEILLDGKRLGSAYFCKFEVHAKKIAKVMIEMYAEVEIDMNTPLAESTRESDYLVKGKVVPIHTLSNYSPKIIAEKK